MKLQHLLSERKSAVVNRWYDAVINTYPTDTSSFLKLQKNPFLNPVGSTIFKSIENLFEELLHGKGDEKVSQYLDNIIRIRAVQDFTPSQCIYFIPLLKKAIREELKSELAEHRLYDEMYELESRIDGMSLLAFDIFMKCREKIYELKANELHTWTFKRLQRADEVCKQESVYKDIHNELIEFERKEVAK